MAWARALEAALVIGTVMVLAVLLRQRLADLGARLVGNLPVGIVTAMIGAPVFVFLLRRYRAAYQL